MDTGGATRANVARNARAERDRTARWTSAREACWTFLAPLLRPDATVAIVGAGNGHTVPLKRLAAGSKSVTLIDIDRVSARMARRRVPLRHRRQVRVIEHDVTGGRAAQIVAAAAAAAPSAALDLRSGSSTVLPGGPYDLIVGDLLYTQLIYPGLKDAGVPADRIGSDLHTYGQPLVDQVVADLHRALTPAGTAVHLHDPIGWFPDRPQTVTLSAILDATSIERARTLVSCGRLVRSGDVHEAILRDAGFGITDEAFWRWPFTPDVDYLVWATAVRAIPSP